MSLCAPRGRLRRLQCVQSAERAPEGRSSRALTHMYRHGDEKDRTKDRWWFVAQTRDRSEKHSRRTYYGTVLGRDPKLWNRI